MCFFQSEKVELEGECRATNEQLAVREAEVEQIPVLRNELEKLQVRISERNIDSPEVFSPSLPPSLPFPSIPLSLSLTLKTERSAMEEICRGNNDAMAVKEQEIAAKQRALSEAEQRVGSLAEECATLKGKLEGNTEQILSLKADISVRIIVLWCTFFLIVSYHSLKC